MTERASTWFEKAVDAMEDPGRFLFSMAGLLACRNPMNAHLSNLFHGIDVAITGRRNVMMRANELQQRFSQIENTIHHAAQRCQSAQAVPMDIKDCIQQLDQKAIQARSMLQSQDEEQIRRCVEDLEELGDRAKDACEHSSGKVDDELKSAIMQAHRELSDLKHQLH